jgi:predicted amidophosphoribosyltransferase
MMGICDGCGNEAELNEDTLCEACSPESTKEDMDGFNTGEEADE